MTYSQVIDYLFNQYPQFQKIGGQAYKPGLDTIKSLCSILDNPQDNLKIIHVAGTNGKGSTCNLLASVLQEAGYSVGLFTSPHLVDFRERIRINGNMIPESEVIAFVVKYKAQFEAIHASFFEWSTALALYYFKKQNTDIVVLETGLGGRLDSTNCVTPILSIITQIGIDHTQYLGDTIEAIALEKAGIIKPNIPCVLAYGNDIVEQVFIAKSAALNSTLIKVTSIPDENKTGLLGDYQKINTATVEKAVEFLRTLDYQIVAEAYAKGLQNVILNTGFRGRWEVLQQLPTVIADIGHNYNGMVQIVKQLELESSKYTTIHIVFGMVADKDIQSIVEILPSQAKYYLCAPNIQRALKVSDLAKNFKNNATSFSYNSCSEAFIAAKSVALPTDLIFVGGSNFVVAEIIENFFQ